MGEVDAVIPEKSSSDSSETTTSNTVINGEINGVCKTNEAMEIDTEDDSQISSGNSITATETESEIITNKKNKLSNKTESSNSNSSSNSDNSNSCSSSGSTNLKQNLTASLSTSNSKSIDNKVKEIVSAEISDENSQKSTKTNFSEEESSSKENGRDCQIDNDNEKIKDSEKQKDKVKENEKENKCESKVEKNSSVKDEKNVSNSKNDSCNKMEVDCSSSPEKSTTSNNNKKETQEKQNVEELSTTTNNSKNDDEKENTKSQSKIENIIQLEKSEKKLAQIEDAPVPMEVDSKSNKDDSSNKTTTATDTTVAPTPPSVEEKKCIQDDDCAVVIPSDSESDNQDSSTTDSKTKTSTTIKEPIKEKEEPKNKKDTEKVIDDDVVEVLSDKDDCVVIEDDDKKDNNSIRRTSRQRKSGSKSRDYSTLDDDDVTEIVDDSQPPTKRARTSEHSVLTAPIGQIGQITIRDARSLMATSFQDNSPKQNFNQFSPQKSGLSTPALVQNSVSAKPNATPYTVIPGGMQPEGVFPVNIRPALAPISSVPPKLVPATIQPTIQNSLIPESPVLPNLTDDMFVLEAPSFIVPYIYEKPPSDNLKEIVAKLATEIKESEKEKEKEDKKDENKDQSLDEDKKDDSSEAKKEKRKKKKRKNPDDSWGESDESTDEDASDAETRTKILIKEVKSDLTSIVTNPEALKQLIMGNSDGDKKSENYFDSPLGKFFIDIGIGLVQEYVQTDLLRQQKRKRDKARGHNASEFEKAINSLKQNLQTSKKRNEPFKFEMRRCEYCNFKSESALVMANHYETPHMRQAMYKCNFCSFEVKPPHDILFHMEAVHNIKGRLDKAPSYHQCPNCPFEDNGKSKLARHLPVCSKKFRPELNLLPPSDWEAPAKIPRIKPRHGLVGTATAYQAMAAQAAAQKAALAQLSQRAVTPTNNTNNAYMRNRGRPQQPTNPPIRPPVPVVPPAANIRGVRQTQPGVMPNVHMTGTQFIQVSGTNLTTVMPNSHNTLALQQQQNTKKPVNSGSGGQPSISITPLPRQPNNQSQNTIPNPLSLQSSTISPISSVQSKPMTTVIKPGQNPSGSKASFVICEICDGYIKDLEQLRNHMQWMHKVKIHPKMIYNRPPLNCQKCQFRFFTDQGLERHLLGSHGLVTSSMQEAANKGKDAGRCPVCGRMYQWKLLNHVSRDHHMTLKPAHLSYKCTVCTATFGMYKQFENHVYTAHSTVAKKAMDNKKNSSSSGGNVSGNMSSIGNNSSNSIMNSSGSTTIQRSSGGSSGSTSLSLGGGNDALLKPLKINDEITIIPQPATKSRGIVNEMESHVIDLSLSSSSKFRKSNNTTITTTTSSNNANNNNNNKNNQSKNNSTSSSSSSGYLMNHSRNNRNFSNNNINNDDIQEISDDDDEEEDDDEDSDPIALSNGTKKEIWLYGETKYLIDCYKKYKYLDKKQYKKNDDLWLIINDAMKRAGYKNNTSNQLKLKFDKLKRTYIKAKRRSNRKNQYKPRAFQFMNEFDELFAKEEEKRMIEKQQQQQQLNHK